MFKRELPKLWNGAIITGHTTFLSIPVNLLHLLTIQESGKLRGRGTRKGDLSSFTHVTHTP